MKTVNELISEIHVDAANFQHIAQTGNINGTLYLGIRDAMAEFAMQEVVEALKLHGIVDPPTQKNEFVIPDVGSQLPDCEHKKRVIRYGIEQCEDCGKPF